MKRTVFTVLFTVLVAATMPAGARGQGGGEGDVRLNYLHVWNGGVRVPRDQYNNPVAARIREVTGVTVLAEGVMMNETERLNLMFASGDMPDIVGAPFWGGDGGETGVIKRATEQGRLHPIDAMLERYPNVKRSYDIGVIAQHYLEADLRSPSFGGRSYLIPVQTPGSPANIINWGYGVFVRGDVPRALGIDPSQIKTQEQLLSFMRRARDYGFRDVNGNPVITASTFHNGWNVFGYTDNFSSQNMTSYIPNNNGTVTHHWLTPEYIEQHMFIWRLVNENILDRESFRHSGTQADTKVGNGTALFFAAQFITGITATKLTAFYTANPGMRYTPVGPMNDRYGRPLVQNEPMGRAGSPVLFFPTTNRNLEATFRYLDFVNTKEGMELISYGIEGSTFVRNAAGQPRLVPDLLERKRRGDSSWEDTMHDAGALFLPNFFEYGALRMEWFGELGVGDADAAIEELEAYKLAKPIRQVPGFPLSALENQFPKLTDFQQTFGGEMERTWRERAYFAATEAEARRILLDFQQHVRTTQNGLFMERLDYMTRMSRTRSDIIF